MEKPSDLGLEVTLRLLQMGGKAMFDLDAFVTECRVALAADPTFESMRKILARAVSDPSAIIERFGAPKRAGVETLYHSADLNILNFVWGPQMTLLPHNHLDARRDLPLTVSLQFLPS
jgi:hypothetical protein